MCANCLDGKENLSGQIVKVRLWNHGSEQKLWVAKNPMALRKGSFNELPNGRVDEIDRQEVFGMTCSILGAPKFLSDSVCSTFITKDESAILMMKEMREKYPIHQSSKDRSSQKLYHVDLTIKIDKSYGGSHGYYKVVSPQANLMYPWHEDKSKSKYMFDGQVLSVLIHEQSRP
jgi:hypothetical protein